MSFKRPVYVRPARAPVVPLERVPNYARSSTSVVVPKDQRELPPGDEERLWAHVRSLPCARCWKEGNTDLSHSNLLLDGKGRGLKAFPWRVAALCRSCHSLIDQGKEMSKTERLEAWNAAHRWTIGELFSRGLVRAV